MNIKFVYKILPYFIKYTDDLPDNVGGRARYIYVEILPQYRDDKGIHAHEETHVKQCYCWLFIPFRLLYNYVESFRFRFELEAFVAQIKCYPVEIRERRLPMFARFLSERYRLKRSYDECLKALKEELITECPTLR